MHNSKEGKRGRREKGVKYFLMTYVRLKGHHQQFTGFHKITETWINSWANCVILTFFPHFLFP